MSIRKVPPIYPLRASRPSDDEVFFVCAAGAAALHAAIFLYLLLFLFGRIVGGVHVDELERAVAVNLNLGCAFGHSVMGVVGRD